MLAAIDDGAGLWDTTPDGMKSANSPEAVGDESANFAPVLADYSAIFITITFAQVTIVRSRPHH